MNIVLPSQLYSNNKPGYKLCSGEILIRFGNIILRLEDTFSYSILIVVAQSSSGIAPLIGNKSYLSNIGVEQYTG